MPAPTALLAEDETDLLLLPSVRSGWALRGQTAPVLISGKNARRTLFGTLHLRSGHLLLMERTRHRGLEFQEFLDFIRWHYRAGPVALLLDEHPTHKDQASQSLADDLDIRLLWLPNRSPQLNPLDHLWGFRQKRSLRQLAATLHRPPSGPVHALLCDAFAHGNPPQGRLVLQGFLASQSVSFIMTTRLAVHSSVPPKGSTLVQAMS